MIKLNETKVISAEPESVGVEQARSFYVGHYLAPFFSRPLHYHKEYELLVIVKGYGTRMIGDHFDRFNEGDVVLIGANLPHVWISDMKFRTDDNEASESYYIQFKKRVFGSHFIEIPELEGVRDVLRKADRGLKLKGQTAAIVGTVLKEMGQKPSFEQLIDLLNALQTIHDGDYELLASSDFENEQVLFENEKINKVHQYVTRHFKEELKIDDCAALIGVTPTSFCRLFKKHAEVTFSEYLNSIRLNFAHKLLLNTNLSIKEICFESGYTSIAYFNQLFRKQTSMSPQAFRKLYS
ncbi:AraC family transcriptional regulator [Mangrovibacterium sp.]|uniref:AraC family transcriptional regulator n=1 Tax=Mangrovibacterium sp. TaxID=1961364 RepID=UPI00356A1FB0